MTNRSMTPEAPDGEGPAERDLAAVVVHTGHRFVIVQGGAGRTHCPATR